MGNFGGAQKTKMLAGMWTIKAVKAVLMRFQVEMRTLLGTRLEAIHATFWQKCVYIFLCPETL
jgi:hypothetical protein